MNKQEMMDVMPGSEAYKYVQKLIDMEPPDKANAIHKKQDLKENEKIMSRMEKDKEMRKEGEKMMAESWKTESRRNPK